MKMVKLILAHVVEIHVVNIFPLIFDVVACNGPAFALRVAVKNMPAQTSVFPIGNVLHEFPFMREVEKILNGLKSSNPLAAFIPLIHHLEHNRPSDLKRGPITSISVHSRHRSELSLNDLLSIACMRVDDPHAAATVKANMNSVSLRPAGTCGTLDLQT